MTLFAQEAVVARMTKVHYGSRFSLLMTKKSELQMEVEMFHVLSGLASSRSSRRRALAVEEGPVEDLQGMPRLRTICRQRRSQTWLSVWHFSSALLLLLLDLIEIYF